MNFFIDGMSKQLVDYPDFLDSIIGTVAQEHLAEVTGAIPEPHPDQLILHFQFDKLPSKLTCRLDKADWRKQSDKLDHFAEQITRIAKILLGQGTVTDLIDLDIEITPELKEWASTENQRRYHQPLVQAPKRSPMPLGYDQDFTTW
jgi:hypothetical protein